MSAAQATPPASSAPASTVGIPAPAEKTKTTTSGKSKHKHKHKQAFSVSGLPDADTVSQAASCLVRDENGEVVSFGELLPRPDRALAPEEEQLGLAPVTRTVALFIRTWWCGQCQDYTLTSISQIDPDACRRDGVRVVVIGVGPWRIAKSYRALLNCPLPIYTVETTRLYKLLGMTSSHSFGPWFKGREEYHRSNLPTQVVHGFHNALFKLPPSKPGPASQLGGEFIFTAGSTCVFAHRMTHRSNHMLAPDVVRLAGVAHPTFNEAKAVDFEESQQVELNKLAAEMQQWGNEREAELGRAKREKAERRGQVNEAGHREVSSATNSVPNNVYRDPRGSLSGPITASTGGYDDDDDDDDDDSFLEFGEFLSQFPPPGVVCDFDEDSAPRKISGIGSPSLSLSELTFEFDQDGFAVDEKLQGRFAEVMALREDREQSPDSTSGNGLGLSAV